MIQASCLCRQVQFEVAGRVSHSRYCHCENCRKISGTDVIDPVDVIDEGDVEAPSVHLWTRSSPFWESIPGDLPHHDTFPVGPHGGTEEGPI